LRARPIRFFCWQVGEVPYRPFHAVRHQQGAALVELSIVIFFCIFVLLSLVDLGRVIRMKQNLARLSREAVNSVFRDCLVPIKDGCYPQDSCFNCFDTACVAKRPANCEPCQAPEGSAPASSLQACVFDRHQFFHRIGQGTVRDFRLALSVYECPLSPTCQINPPTVDSEACYCLSAPLLKVLAADAELNTRYHLGHPSVQMLLAETGRLAVAEIQADYSGGFVFFPATRAYEAALF